MLPLLRKLIPEDSIIRKSYSWGKAFAAKIIYRNPSKNLKVIGITGTDGKTSTTHFTAELLELLGLKVAMSSTEEIWMAGEKRNNTTKRTTLSPFTLQSFLKEAKEKKCDVAILEVSSHAITQGRILGIEFDAAAVTNISQEHGNYHGGLENYAETKAELFRKVRGSKKKNKMLIVNKNMDFYELFSSVAPEITRSFSSNHSYLSSKMNIECHPEPVEGRHSHQSSSTLRQAQCDTTSISATIIETQNNKTLFNIKDNKNTYECSLNIPGSYNVENILISTIFSQHLGFSMNEITKQIPKIHPVSGRLQEIQNLKADFKVYIDFAVTAGAMENVLKSLKSSTKGKVFVVFGATGANHDHEKRPLLGKAATEYANFAVLTEDETYGEDNEKIMEEVAKGFIKSKKNFKIIAERKDAIYYALSNAKKDDVIVITGMGSFSTRFDGENEIPWSDEECVREFFSDCHSRTGQAGTGSGGNPLG